MNLFATRRRIIRTIAATVWGLVLGAAVLWIYLQGLSIRDVMRLIYAYVVANPIAPVVYVVIYALRPLTFFPAMWLTISAGSLFGFGHGLIFALIGENMSANTAYALARFFRSERYAQPDPKHRLDAFRRMLVENSFPTVLVLRASYLPFDLVNFACGLLRVPWPAYLGASIIGMLPPMITFVSFGATVNLPELLSRKSFSPDDLIDTKQLLISGALVIASTVIAFWAVRRRKKLAAAAAQQRIDGPARSL